ncbi:trifunctional dihydropteroate synthetase [Marasmius sp. AFHP31]|nr:trifunctional dihydropteroate synthetase [Marasmius sp. AFHP31]
MFSALGRGTSSEEPPREWIYLDLIKVNDLLLNVLLSSGSRWPAKVDRPTAQPLQISLAIPHSVHSTAETDDLSRSINYSTLAATLRTSLSPSSSSTLDPVFKSLEPLVHRSFQLLLNPSSTSAPELDGAYIRVLQLRPPLHCKTVGIASHAVAVKGTPWHAIDVSHFVEDLECHTIVGVNAVERLEKQLVRINIVIEQGRGFALESNIVDIRELTRRIYEVGSLSLALELVDTDILWQSVEKTSYLTLEALASHIALDVLKVLQPIRGDEGPKVNVKAAKPDALVFAGSSEVEVWRTFTDYPNEFQTKSQSEIPTSLEIHTVALALGSNLGDSFQNIELALRLLETPSQLLSDQELSTNATVDVVETSFLYESAPMYVTEQPSFINGACLIETNLPPTTLLKLLKKIEDTVGRVPSIRNGPRAIDLDILFFDSALMDTRDSDDRENLDNLSGHLVIPHPRITEREFVLRPLNDMIPNYVHPVLHKPVNVLLRELLFSLEGTTMKRVMPIPRLPFSLKGSLPSSPPTSTHWTYPIPGSSTTSYPHNSMNTYLMSILNVTPDSFSDGSQHNTLSAALDCVRDAVSSGADIIDIGGYSTRPGADFVSIEEETRRVVPVIEAIRQLDNADGGDILISVDTFRPDVARGAIEAGANCINDVNGFTGPNYSPTGIDDEESQEYMREMKKVAREHAVPVILMHSRGDAGKTKDYDAYKYSRDSSVLEAIRVELGSKVDAIVKGKGGLRRWLVVVDPGVGFSKSVEDNLETLRHASAVTADIRVGRGESLHRTDHARLNLGIHRSKSPKEPTGKLPATNWAIEKVIPRSDTFFEDWKGARAKRKSLCNRCSVRSSEEAMGKVAEFKLRHNAETLICKTAQFQSTHPALVVTVLSILKKYGQRYCTSRKPLNEVSNLTLLTLVHGSLARAGKVKSQCPKVEPQEKKKTPKGRAKKRLLYNRRFVNVTTLPGGKRKMNANPEK